MLLACAIHYLKALTDEILVLKHHYLEVDMCEDKWYHKRNAQINIQSMILPRVW